MTQSNRPHVTTVTVNFCPRCDLRIYEGPQLCFACGGVTTVREEALDQLTVYASTTVRTANDVSRTLAYVDAGRDLRFLADVEAPVAIGATGYLLVEEADEGVQRFTFREQSQPQGTETS